MLCGINMALFRFEFLAQNLFVLALLLLLAAPVCAQSTDPNAPSAVRANTVTARIAARDLGDARLTDHYNAFTGTPGDLLITIQSNNLNGDVDIFTATDSGAGGNSSQSRATNHQFRPLGGIDALADRARLYPFHRT